ncbi:SGNH/GDSL hydrolase family protein [Frigoribacterium sp. UYMn621]|uniref:SGNH/GDSL hydrolase family protein n=1 Tax=Frigoribacterium sp. UYMn621 TaxID=3156343 RepID=UPI003390FB3E
MTRTPATPRVGEDVTSARLFVALGDSFTEGVGDPDARLPNGVRGWADRVAEKLAKAEPGWRYANLAVRSKRIREVVTDQLDAALRLHPTLITLYAGGNDVLDPGTEIRSILEDYERLVKALSETGATLLLFTGYDVPLYPVVWLFRRRNHAYNEGVRRIAQKYGATLVDYWTFDGYQDRRMWSADRLHLSKFGHKLLAARVLDVLAVRHSITPKQFDALESRSTSRWLADQGQWVHDWVVPLLHRKIRRVTLGDWTEPRWPHPVEVPPKGGLRRLMRERAEGTRE